MNRRNEIRVHETNQVAALLGVASAVMAGGGNCILSNAEIGVPKLYAHHQPSKQSGPHEIVCACPDLSLDLWHSLNGRSPKLIKANISHDEASDIVLLDYKALKRNYLIAMQR